MKNKKTITLLVFGTTSSGKTVFQTALWAASNQENIPDDVNQDFKRIHENLLMGKPTEGTIISNRLPPKNLFQLKNDDGLEIKTIDYAGEDAEKFLKEDGGNVRKLLIEADAVLLLIDAFSLHRAESFEKWFEKHGYDNLFHWFADVLSGRHTKGLPFTIALSRSDLVESERVKQFVKEVQSITKNYQLAPVVRSLSVFGEHKADLPIPGLGDIPLSFDFQCPKVNLQLKDVEDIVLELANRHEKTKKKSLLPVVLILFLLIGGMSLTVHSFTRPQPVEKKDISDITEKHSPLDIDLPDLGIHNGTLAELHEAFRREMDSRGAEHGFDVQKLDEIFARHISKHLSETEKTSQIMRFEPTSAEWKYTLPSEYIEYYENALFNNVRDKSALISIQDLKKTELDRIVKESGSDLSLDVLGKLMYEYVDIDENAPNDLADQYATQSKRDFLDNLAGLLKSPASELSTVYMEKIPKIIRNLQSGLKTNRAKIVSFEKDLQELEDYISLLRKFADGGGSVEFVLDRVDRIGESDDMPNEVIVQTGVVKRQYVRNMNSIPVKMSWRLGEPIEIKMRVDHGWNYRKRDLKWGSRKYSAAFKTRGHDVPGLSFLIFRDAAENERRFKVNDIRGGKYEAGEYKLLINQSNELTRLGNLPDLLVRANKLRKKGD